MSGGGAPEAGIRILLVEDNAGDRELIQRAFRTPAPLSGPIDVEVSTDADAALAAVRRTTFSVVLTDYSLPGQSGLDLVRAMREANDPTPIVMMTGSGDETLAVAALRLGAADYVVKDLGFERALPLVVERVLTKQAATQARKAARQRNAEGARRLERQIDDQTQSLQRALQESEALRRVGRALAATHHLKPALDLVTRTIAELLRARAAAAMIRADTDFVLASVWGALKVAPGLRSPSLPAALSEGWAETAAAPLRDDSAEIGLLWAGRSSLQEFDPHELELLETIADLTALCIRNVRAHEQLRKRRGTAASEAPPKDEPKATVQHVNAKTLSVPPFPAALGRLLELAEHDDPEPDAIAEAVALDPALTKRAMEVASAAALGRVRAAGSVREAITVLGMRGIRNLAFAQFTRGMAVRGGLIDELLWEQALWAATGAQMVVTSLDPSAADDAYLCGLVHNVGAVALNNSHPSNYERALRASISECRPLAQTENSTFGRTACSVTAEIIAGWSLPVRVAATVRAWTAGGGPAPLGAALAWASSSALYHSPVWVRLLAGGAQPDWLIEDIQRGETQLGLPDATMDAARLTTTERVAVLNGMIH